MKKQILLLMLLCVQMMGWAQESVTLTGETTDEHFVTRKVTQQLVTKTRRMTSQGDPQARLSYKEVPGNWAVPLAESLMKRYPDYRYAYWKDYTYVHGYAFEVLLRLYDQTGDKRYLNYVVSYIDHFVDEEGNYKGDALTNLDNFMTGSAFCSLYYYTGQQKYKKAALQILKAVDDYPSSDGQFWHGNKSPNMWIDGVFMMQMFLTRCAQYVGNKDQCLEIACRNVIAAAKHLQREDGLLLHAWTTQPEKAKWADRQTGLSPEVWSEGMGWYALLLPELLHVLTPVHPAYQQIYSIYQRMAQGIRQYQDTNTGGWYMVVDKGSNAMNYIDPSGTAMFIYSIQRGIDLNLLRKKDYAKVAQRGYECLRDFIQVNKNGLLDVLGGCDGVGIKTDFISYVTIPKMKNAKETVIGMLWAGVIMEKNNIKKQ